MITLDSDNKKKKIVIGANDLILGGVQRLIIDQLNLIDRSLFEVHLIILMEFPQKLTFDELIPSYVVVHRLKFFGFKDFKKWRDLYKLLKQLQPEIVMTATFFSNTVFLTLKSFFGYEVVASEHNTINIKPLWQRLVDKILLPNAYTVIAASKEVVEFVSKNEGISEENFTVIYNGVDLDAVAVSEKKYSSKRNEIRNRFNIKENEQVILNVARLVRQKNHEVMIEGFAKLYETQKDVHLIITGDGKPEKEQRLQKLVEDRGIKDNVHLLFGDHGDLHRLYTASDIFLLTSRHEGFCIAAMEGLAFGLPLVSTRVAGISEYLINGENGLFIESNPNDVAKKLETIILFSEEEKMRFSEAARRTAEEYSTKRYGNEINTLLKKILRNN